MARARLASCDTALAASNSSRALCSAHSSSGGALATPWSHLERWQMTDGSSTAIFVANLAHRPTGGVDGSNGHLGHADVDPTSTSRDGTACHILHKSSPVWVHLDAVSMAKASIDLGRLKRPSGWPCSQSQMP